jgi:methylenetetrahydrofolate reductase (NADPH)
VALADGARRASAAATAGFRRRLSSLNADPHNRVIVDIVDTARADSVFEASAEEAGIPKEKNDTRAATVAISEGEGALGREATWDDYPNGRWGDARSPGMCKFIPLLPIPSYSSFSPSYS